MLEAEIESAAELAREAGRILMDIYARDFAVHYKGDNDPVTDADRLASDYLVAELRRRFPDDGVVSEENEDHAGALDAPRCWFVDPLDGTKEFIKKNGEFSVMLGLAIGAESRLGVVYQPTEDKLYRGVVGVGASLEQHGETRSLQVSDQADAARLRLVVSRSHRPDSIGLIMERLGATEERPSGSVGLKVGKIAEQQAELYVHVSDRSSAWDACGPEAVLRASGGVFSDLAGDAFRYDSEEMANKRGIFACNGAGSARALEAARGVAREIGFL